MQVTTNSSNNVVIRLPQTVLTVISSYNLTLFSQRRHQTTADSSYTVVIRLPETVLTEPAQSYWPSQTVFTTSPTGHPKLF
ncbi:hypothetical protein BaRGS_00011746 [Batillaria attramentaria]|uniref:Uncharacterized protein n=1 Tax=Batillaria attramentaria TaxID=370345 RepID=A0ABD0LCB5_9CAEN